MSTIYACEISCSNCGKPARQSGTEPAAGRVEVLKSALIRNGWKFDGKKAYCSKCAKGMK